MVKLCLTLIFALVVIASSQTPIPNRPPGYVIQNHPNPDVVIDIFYDYLCDDSMDNWPIFEQIQKEYEEKPFKLLVHIFPLPNHHNAYFMQIAGEVVKNASRSSVNYIKFLSEAFKQQEEFLTGAVDLTEPQVQAKIATFAEQCCSIPTTVMTKGFTDPVIINRARTAWKYAAHRGISGTPQFIVNGVHLPDAPDFKFEEWKRLIDNLMTSE